MVLYINGEVNERLEMVFLSNWRFHPPKVIPFWVLPIKQPTRTPCFPQKIVDYPIKGEVNEAN